MNRFIIWLSSYKEEHDLSYRALGQKIGFSHTHVLNVIRGHKPLTWDFCAAVAENLGLEHEQAFIMAGLWPDDNNKQGDQTEAQSPRIGERHNGSIPKS